MSRITSSFHLSPGMSGEKLTGQFDEPRVASCSKHTPYTCLLKASNPETALFRLHLFSPRPECFILERDDRAEIVIRISFKHAFTTNRDALSFPLRMVAACLRRRVSSPCQCESRSYRMKFPAKPLSSIARERSSHYPCPPSSRCRPGVE